MAYIKSISIYDSPTRTVDYITKSEKQKTIFVDGTPYTNITAKIIQSAKREIAGTQAIFDYVTNPTKTNQLTTAQNCAITTAPKDFENIQKLKKRKVYQYVKGKREIKAHHLIQSFKVGEGTPEQIHKIGIETVRQYFGENAQFIIATHTDQQHLHNHILVNSVDLEGNKIHMGKLPMRKLRSISDAISKSYGLSVITPKGKSNSTHYKTWERQNPQKRFNQYYEKLRMDIDRAILACSTFEDFKTQLHKQGYQTKTGKHFAMCPPNSTRYTRTKTLGENYTEERIIQRMADPHKHHIQQHGKIISFKDFALQRRAKYTAQNAILLLQYLSILEIIFRLIVNNAFSESKKVDLSNPYGLFNDYHFAKYLHQLLFLEENKIHTKADYQKFKQHHNPIFNEIDETITGFEMIKENAPDLKSHGAFLNSKKIRSNQNETIQVTTRKNIHNQS